MKFEVRYPTGTPHEVTLQGTVAILGRDPSCDLVLNDPRCSRRHAVVEAGPQGLSIRDTGSANGVVVNGEKLERATLKPGDEIRLGEIVLRVLPEDMPGTVMMGPEDMEDFPGAAPPPAVASQPAPPPAPPSATALPPVAAPQPPVAPPRPASPVRPPAPPAPPLRPAPRDAPPQLRPSEPRPPRASVPRVPPPQEQEELEPAEGPIPRSMVVSLLAVLWAMGFPLYAGLGIYGLTATEGMWRVASVATGGMLALLSAAMAFGIWSRSGWARNLQIVLAGLGILTCAFAPVSIAVLVYMLRSDTRLQFSGQDLSELSPEEADAASRDSVGLPFTIAILAALFVSWLVAGGVGLLFGSSIGAMTKARQSANASAAIGNLRTLVSAQEAFRAGTCDGYADFDGLVNPANVIPNYPVGGPSFLSADFARPIRNGYRYELRAEDPLPPQEGCPARLYRRYRFSANPESGSGRHFLVESDAIIYVALDRPATPQDPPLN